MDIQRIDTYQDPRFNQHVLNQHGCFLVDSKPFEIEIVREQEAIIRGSNAAAFPALIEEFRFFAPHITQFRDAKGVIVKQFSKANILTITLKDIQPSQFYVDSEKINAIRSFIHSEQDVIIQVLRQGDRYISLDGHTRLYYAVMNGWTTVRAVEVTSADYIYGFVKEAQKRKIYSPYDLQLVSHEDYQIKWNDFCEQYFQCIETAAVK